MSNILLFPGGFKPFHDGHLSILNSYLNNIDNVHFDYVYIIISNKNRGSINANTTYNFLNNIKDNLNYFYNTEFNIMICDIPSPIHKCYWYVGNSLNDDKFSLVSSNKNNDIIRTNDFINAYQQGGKYYNELIGEKTIRLNVDIEPTIYKFRDDKFNNENISSTIIRDDIKNNDYFNFKAAYINMLYNQIITNKQLYNYFKKLTKT